MSSFTPAPAAYAVPAPDPSKHVNFSQGMVLGVDDFNQEFAYLSNRDQWLARDLLGYGTVCGLRVSPITDGKFAPGVRVDPGVALNSRGQFIRVDAAKCAAIDGWLKKDSVKADMIDNHRISAGKISFYLILCYRACLTDSRPIPGEPCRTETGLDDSLLKPSRIQDYYYLDFVWEAPDQTEEDSLRDFVAWLRQIKIAETGSSLDDFAAAVRNAVGPLCFMQTPLPGGMTIPSAQEGEYLRLAFRIWATEARPLRRGENYWRDFAGWIGQITRVAGTGSNLDDFAAAIRKAIDPQGFMRMPPPNTITIPSAQEAEYLGLAFRIWATEALPLRRGEDYWRDFANWIGKLTRVVGTGSSLDDFAAAIRKAIDPQGFMRMPPPNTITIPSAQEAEYLNLAFSIWETEICPLRGCAGSGCATSALENCVLLAKLEASLAEDAAVGWTVNGNVTIHQEERPYLLHLRFLQEWMFGGGFSEDAAGGPTRILASSWPHGGNTQLDIHWKDGASSKGLVVAFGKSGPGDGGLARVERGSLDLDTFQVFVELLTNEAGVDFYTYRRIHPDKILPVQVEASSGSLITQVSLVAGPAAGAAALLLSDAAFNYLENKKLLVVIKGDYVLDETGKHAIHAGPVGRTLAGGEGGNFESWVRVGMLIDINTASEEQLQALSGIGPAYAQRIVAYRTDNGQFTSIDGLLSVKGIGAELLNGIRPFVTVNP